MHSFPFAFSVLQEAAADFTPHGGLGDRRTFSRLVVDMSAESCSSIQLQGGDIEKTGVTSAQSKALFARAQATDNGISEGR